MHSAIYIKSQFVPCVFENVVKKRLPSQIAALLSASLKPMDTGTTTHTTRKGFLKRAGVAIAAAFTLGGAAHATSSSKQTATQAEKPSAMSRIRPAKGAVARKSVELT